MTVFPVIVALLLLLVGVLDIVSTTRALSAGALEANPLMRWVQANLGDAWIGVKMLAHFMLAGVVLYAEHDIVSIVGLLCVLGFALVIANNFRLARKAAP